MVKNRQHNPASPQKTVITVIIITLAVTLLGGYATQQAISTRLNDFFNRQADQIANTYTNKLNTQITILQGIQGLWNSAGTLTEHSLSDYLTLLDLSSFDKTGASSYFLFPQLPDQISIVLYQRSKMSQMPRLSTIHSLSTQIQNNRSSTLLLISIP